MEKTRTALFLDRDDTLIRTINNQPVNNPTKVKLVEGVVEGLTLVRKSIPGILLVVVTNQSAVEKGSTTMDRIFRVGDAINDLLVSRGAPEIDAMYACPHYLVDCRCRKPKPGLITTAARDLHIDLGRSYMIGDSDRDVQAGQAAGVAMSFKIGAEGTFYQICRMICTTTGCGDAGL